MYNHKWSVNKRVQFQFIFLICISNIRNDAKYVFNNSANQAFMALLAAETGLHPTEYRNWAKSQIGYILGDAGRSYVVGFGVNPPSHEHHRAAYVIFDIKKYEDTKTDNQKT